jgi:hypothetical protein
MPSMASVKTSSKKNTRKTSRKRAAPLVSITAKIQPSRLKKTISRRHVAMRAAARFDQSLPEELRTKAKLAQKKTRPDIIISDVLHLSPYIIHLNEHVMTPEEIIEMEELHVSAPNLLFARDLDTLPQTSAEPNKVPQQEEEKEEDTLTLQATDLEGQLSEAPLALHKWPRWSFPSLDSLSLSVRKQAKERLAALETKPLQTFSIETLSPAPTPENISNYFDLPEEEAEETTHINDEIEELDLDLLSQSIQQEEEKQTEKTKQKTVKMPAWQMPHLALPKASFTLPQGWLKTVAAFVIVSFAFVLPLQAMHLLQDMRETKGDIEQFGTSGLENFKAGSSALLGQDVASAGSAFTRAASQFEHAENTIEEIGSTASLLLSTLPGTKESFQTAEALTKTGTSLSQAGASLSKGLQMAQDYWHMSPTTRLELILEYAENALPSLEKAQNELKEIDTSVIPASYQTTFKELETSLPLLASSVNEFVQFGTMAKTILGAEGTKRYLLIFQNNTEIRATGGFMGSFAEIKVHDGEIIDMTVPGGGTYDLQGLLQTNLVSPAPLQLLSGRWEFQDANWFADFPTSARMMLDFYEDAGGPTVDGVIAVNATYVEDLIGVLGPVKMDDYDRTINEENFLLEAQKIVELEYDKQENKPKAFIGDLASILLERVMDANTEDFMGLLSHANTGLRTKDIQIYFTDDDLQRQTLTLGWAGALQQTDSDYLLIVDTNLGGGKTDGVITQNGHLSVAIQPDGSIINTLTVSRTHEGIQGALFSGVNNVDYVRIYTPRGSELLSASGFNAPDEDLFEFTEEDWTVADALYFSESTKRTHTQTGTDIFEESGKTVFGNWVQTKPGTTSTYTFSYRLPFTIDTLQAPKNLLTKAQSWIGVPQTNSYTLTIQKQSGIQDRSIEIDFSLPETLDALWTSHTLENIRIDNTTDQFIGLLLERQE